MVPTKDLTKPGNPYTHSAYYEDAREKPNPTDKQWGRVQDSDVLPYPHPMIEERKKSAASWLEMRMRTLAMASEDKQRWQRITEHANSLADERGMSHEEFYSKALIEFIEKIENLRITEELNEVYKNIDQEEENAFLHHLVSHYDSRLADE